MAASAPAQRNGSTLCLACGLCCHGVLHDRADLQPDEVDAAHALGLPVETSGGQISFALPCPKVCGSRCTIYEQRLSTCSGYRCGLLNSYVTEEIGEAQALSHVREAKRLLGVLAETLPAGQSLRDSRASWRSGALLRQAQQAQGAERERLGRAQLHMTMLARLIDRHFFADREGRMLITSDADGGSGQAQPRPSI